MPINHLNLYIFGNSLVNYTSSSPNSNIIHWMNDIVNHDGNSFSVEGEYGFLRDFETFPPQSNWGFEGVSDVVGDGAFSLGAFDAIMITPANFIQGRDPTAPYEGDNPNNANPLDTTLSIIKQIQEVNPSAPIYIYEGWADMGNDFPPTSAQLEEYYNYNQNEYHNWFVDYVSSLNAELGEENVYLVPVASTLAKLLNTGPLSELQADELYVDSAPHGTDDLYFLAGAITYSSIFETKISENYSVPSEIHPIIQDRFGEVSNLIENYLSFEDIASINPILNLSPDIIQIDSDEIVLIDVLSNDTTTTNNSLLVSNISTPESGIATVVSNQIQYVPNTGFFGTETLTYEVTNSEGFTSTSTLTVTVNQPILEAIDEPVDPDNLSLDYENPAQTIDLLANGTDEETQPIFEGFQAEYYILADPTTTLASFDFAQDPAEIGHVTSLNTVDSNEPFWLGGPNDMFAAQFTSNLQIENAGAYNFLITADDQVRLIIDGQTEIDTSDLEGANFSSANVNLSAGKHSISIQYLELTEEQSLLVQWEGLDTQDQRVLLEGTALRSDALPATAQPAPNLDIFVDESEYTNEISEPVASNPEAASINDQNTAFPTFGAYEVQASEDLAPTGQLGFGLQGITETSTQNPFLDAMKSARPWVGHTENEWGAIDLEATGLLDSNGWLTAMPDDAYSVQSFVLMNQSDDSDSLSGRYILNYEGNGTIEINGLVENVVQADGRIEFDFTPGDGEVGISILATDQSDYIRDISIVKETNLEAFSEGQIFNPDWLAHIQNAESVRFMDWMLTNGSEEENWSDRPTVDDYTYVSKGAPIEVMVELANQVGIDPWFNIPHKANDEYVEQFASYVEQNLDPDLVSYVEYSNEIWNFLFPQAQWLNEQATERWGEDAPEDSWLQYGGMRSAQIANIWKDIFKSSADDRLVSVAATHTGWPGLEEALLEAPLFVQENPLENSAPIEAFDAYAVAGYFGSELGSIEMADQVLGWIDSSLESAENAADILGLTGNLRQGYVIEHRYDEAFIKATEVLENGSLKQLIEEEFAYHSEVANSNGLELVMYEGGTHVLAAGILGNNDELVEFFSEFNYSPEMATLYQTLLQGWSQAGGTLFNAFVDVSAPSKYGSWGALRHLDDENARWDVLMEYTDSAVFLEEPSLLSGDLDQLLIDEESALIEPDVLVNNAAEIESAIEFSDLPDLQLGREIVGSANADNIDADFVDEQGNGQTSFNDTVIGGEGNDTIFDSEGNDIVDGGAGNDYLYDLGGGDTLLGGDGKDYISAGAGADYIDGGEGVDRLSYKSSSEGIVLDLQDFSQSTGIAAGDEITNIERFEGSRFDDVIQTNGSGIFMGSSGNDVLIASQGLQYFKGGQGNDRFQMQFDNSSVDQITDFDPARDKIDLSELRVFDIDGIQITQYRNTSHALVEAEGLQFRVNGQWNKESDSSNLNAGHFEFTDTAVFLEPLLLDLDEDAFAEKIAQDSEADIEIAA